MAYNLSNQHSSVTVFPVPDSGQGELANLLTHIRQCAAMQSISRSRVEVGMCSVSGKLTPAVVMDRFDFESLIVEGNIERFVDFTLPIWHVGTDGVTRVSKDGDEEPQGPAMRLQSAPSLLYDWVILEKGIFSLSHRELEE